MMRKISRVLLLGFCLMMVAQMSQASPYHNYGERRRAPYRYTRPIQGRPPEVREYYYDYPDSGGPSSQSVYYACPNGDYISNNPGTCPLDGSPLIPRGDRY